MCSACFSELIYRFPSAHSFEVFDAALIRKLSAHQLTASEVPRLDNADAAFTCRTCQETWVLSTPDNAWRGFFLPQAAVAQRAGKSQKTTSTNLVFWLVLVALNIMFIIWLSMN